MAPGVPVAESASLTVQLVTMPAMCKKIIIFLFVRNLCYYFYINMLYTGSLDNIVDPKIKILSAVC